MLYGRGNPHGGGQYGQPVRLDFSVNTNPLGTPPAVMRAVEASAGRLHQYPDPCCRALVAALAAYEGVPEAYILCGCGAAELIFAYCAALRPRRALELAPTFSEYAAALEAVGCQVERYALRPEDSFAVGEGFLQALERTGCDTVFLCNPNNPTGRLIRPEVLEAACGMCVRRGIRLFVDECFLPLSSGGQSLKGRLADMPGLFLLKALTKSHAMAGLRLGYCVCGDAALLDAMRGAGQPWAVSGPAQAAGIAALRETQYVQAVRGLVARERPRLAGELSRLGLRVIPGEANYLLFFSPAPLLEPLRERGILLRDCGNYRGLEAGWYRTAVRTQEENRRLIQSLEEILKEGTP